MKLVLYLRLIFDMRDVLPMVSFYIWTLSLGELRLDCSTRQRRSNHLYTAFSASQSTDKQHVCGPVLSLVMLGFPHRSEEQQVFRCSDVDA